MTRLERLALLACLAAGPGADARAQVIPVGSEIQVNVHTMAGQRLPSVDVDADGDFVVVWESYGQDSYDYDVFARRFSAAGVPQATEFRANVVTSGGQRNGGVGLDAAGNFVVVWVSNGQDGSGYGVFARRFNSAGAPQASEFKVNEFTAGSQVQPAVDLDANGDFVITWQSPNQDGSQAGVFARRFNSAGVAQASEFQVNSYVTGYQATPAVALDPDGDFVIAWSSQQDGSNFGVFGRRWSSSGAPQGIEFQINVFTPDIQGSSSVDLDADGDFVVSWSSQGQDGSSYGIFARRFSSTGAAVGGELQVNVYTSFLQRDAVLSMESDGDFVVTWNSQAVDASASGISARRFRANGTPKSSELLVNRYVTGDQFFPSVGVTDGGTFVVAWQSQNQDGDSYGVFARRFSSLALDIDGDGTVAPLTDGLLLVRHYFGFSGSTLTSGAVGAGCTRCTASAIESYLGFGSTPQGTPLRKGGEFQVSSFTLYDQFAHAVGMRTDGGFVIIWQDRDIDDQGVFARRFDAQGSLQGAQFRVHEATRGFQGDPAIAQDPSGNFVVVWTHQPYSATGIRGRRFDAAGVAQGFGDFYLNACCNGTNVDVGDPAVATRGPHFVVTWTRSYPVGGFIDFGVFGRHVFDPQFQINTYTTRSQADTDVAMDMEGNFVVVWVSEGQESPLDTQSRGIFARLFDTAGVPLGNEFQVNSYTPFVQIEPAVAMSSAGDFVVVWENRNQNGFSDSILARRFGPGGNPESGQLPVASSLTSGLLGDPDVAMSGDGGFFVAWEQGDDVFARGFNADGTPEGGELQVNTYTTSFQFGPAIAGDGDRQFVVVWQSNGQDGSGAGVFAQRFGQLSPFDIDGDGTLAALTDGLLVLRFLFGFTGATLISGAVDPDCTRCTAPAIEAYLQSLL